MGAPQAAGPSFVQIAPNVAQTFDTTPATQLIAFNGKLYSVQTTIGSGGGNINGVGVFRSTDGGSTWTQMDAANAPTSGFGTAFFDSANSLLIFGLVTITFPQTQQATFLKNFNLATETWQANFAPGGPVAKTVVQQVFKRPDGTIFIVYDFGSTNPGGTTRLRGAFWNGAAWSASIDLGANTLGIDASGNIVVANTGAVMDASGNINLAFSNNTRSYLFYQQVLANNTLGPSNQFLGTGFVNTKPVVGTVLISGSNILISIVTNASKNNTLLIGTPLNAPVWSSVSPAVLSSASGHVNFAGPLATDGSNLIWMIDTFDPTFAFDTYQLAKSTDNGQTWNLLPDNVTAPFFYDFAPGQSPQAPNTDPTFGTSAPYLAVLSLAGTPTAYGFANVNNSTVGLQSAYFLNSEAVAAPTPPVVANVTLPGGGGDQVVHGGCRPMNEFDFCLLREMSKWKRIRPLPVCSVPKDLWGVLPWEPEWGSLPALAVPFRKIQSIVTPAAAAGDQVVSQLIVPQGYDGILAGVYWRYNGIGFIEGSGDIFWRIQVNMRFVKDLSNVGFTLGSSTSPLPMTEGQLLQSRQRVSVIVNVPDVSGMIQVGTSTITGGLFGFFWPKGVPGWTSR